MNCAWKSYLNLLPPRLRQEVDKHGFQDLIEVRLRCAQRPELVCATSSRWLDTLITAEDLRFTINIASQYSAWASATGSQGYITAPGGHRIGMCGQAIISHGTMTGIREPTSLCIRVAKDLSGIACPLSKLTGSTLILGRPGSGKTTLLRDLIRQKSASTHIAVVDSRQELFPIANGSFCFDPGARTDILSCSGMSEGLDALIRCMNPVYVAVDEITAADDCKSLLNAGWCGVGLLATAHAGCKEDLFNRPVYRPLIEKRVFDHLVIMNEDRTWYTERMELC